MILPNALKSIGNVAFRNCLSLTSITIPKTVTNIGNEAFTHCTSLTNTHVATENEDYASVDGVLFTKDMKTIISYPAGNKSTSYTIPNSVTKIEWGTFSDNANLINVTIPNSVTDISLYAFRACTGLTSIVIPDGVTEISVGIFDRCTGLTSITIPSSISRIRYGAFAGCTSLKSITIPSSVISVEQAFGYCDSLTKIYVDPSNLYYTTVDGILFTKDMQVLVLYPSGKEATSYAIPDTVTIIGDGAFSGNANLISIALSEKVISIGNNAFSRCFSLTDINIPNGIKSIGDFTFHYCDSLVSIVIPDSVTSIGFCAFAYSQSLSRVIIPSSVTSIGEHTFDDCKNLTVYGSANSFAQQYAAEKKIAFSTNAPPSTPAIPVLTVFQTSSPVIVNGVKIAFDAYEVFGNNYFKLRDLATVLSGTTKRFEVTWDNSKQVINLISDRPYTRVGGEMAIRDGGYKYATPSTAKVYIDGQLVLLKAYTINGNNYFKLRDVMRAFDVGVTWNAATRIIEIDTRIGYVAP